MTPTQTGSSLDGLERRRCVRHQVKSLAYLDIGADNGGIVLNISESGLAVHAVSSLPPDPTIDLRLQLHKSCKRLETRAKVAWLSDTKKEAGVEFIDLPEEVRLEIKEWLALENLEPLYIAREKQRLQTQPSAPELASTRAKARSDKWTNLVSEWSSIPAGIDRAGESPRAAAHPGMTSEPMAAQERVAPVDLAAILAGDEPAIDTAAPDFGNVDSLLTECKQPSLESSSIAARPIERPLSPSSPESGELQYRRRDPAVGLPSDKLLSSKQRSDVVVPRDNKTENANGSRNRLDPGSSATHSEDFARKTRELFGPKSLPGVAPRPKDSVGSVLNSAATTAAWHAKDNLNEHSLATVPMSGVVVASALPAETSISNVSRPSTSSRPPTARLEAPTDVLKASPSERSWNLRSFVGLLALCLLLSAGCLGLGIVVGRSVAMHSPNDANSGNEAAAQATSVDQPVPSAEISPSQKQSRNRNQKFTHAHSSPLDVASHQKPAAGSRGENMDSSENGSDDPPDNAQADRPTVQTNSEAPSASNAGGNGVSVTPPPVTPITATAPSTHATAIPNSNAAPRTQPPADRLVAAHLIYRVEPFYPKEALQQRVEGTVKIHATVGQDGRVKNLRVISGPASLTSAALSAAQYWRYVPALRNGEPIETDEDISIEFHLLH
jgi:periplasmic protein TonB